MIRTRVEPIDLDVEAIVDEALSPEAASRQIAAIAREELAEAKAVNRAALGRRVAHETFVDGRRNAPLDTVRPDGRIVFAFDVVEGVLAWIGAELVRHSPVLTGEYARSHVLLADGVPVEPGRETPAAEEYVFVSTVPYARKIERGLSPQAPDGVYEGIALLAARRFGNAASIKFTFRGPIAGTLLGWAENRRLPPMRPKARRRQLHKDVRNPAIMVRIR